MFVYNGAKQLPVVAEAVSGFIHFFLILFFVGLGDAVLTVDTIVGFFTLVPIVICGILYLCTLAMSSSSANSTLLSLKSSVRLLTSLHLVTEAFTSESRSCTARGAGRGGEVANVAVQDPFCDGV